MKTFFFSPAFFLTVLSILLYFKWNNWSQIKKRVYFTFFIIFFYVSSTPFLFNYVSYKWERRFELFEKQSLPINTSATIVVLGSGFNHDDVLPKTGLLGSSALSRLVEAVRIANFFPNSMIHTSGNSATGKTSGAVYLRDAAIELGIQPERITIQSEPHNTYSEAQFFAQRYYNHGDTVILVTSAIHIPRARKHFFNAGVVALYAAPCDYLTFSHNQYYWHNFIPSVSYWAKIERLTKEIVGYYLTL